MLTFPAPQADFIEQLKIKSVTFEVPEAVEMNRTAGGDIIRDNLGARLWRGEVMLGRMTRDEVDDARALIDVMRGAGTSFLIGHRTRRFPRLDPDGSILGSVTPSIRFVHVDARQCTLQGLPAFYELRRGDYLSFEYRNDPVRYALHRVVDASVTAFSNGNTPTFEVVPPMRPGYAIGAPVNLVDATCKAVIVPGSVQAGTDDRFMSTGMGFQFQQTLRG